MEQPSIDNKLNLRPVALYSPHDASDLENYDQTVADCLLSVDEISSSIPYESKENNVQTKVMIKEKLCGHYAIVDSISQGSMIFDDKYVINNVMKDFDNKRTICGVCGEDMGCIHFYIIIQIYNSPRVKYEKTENINIFTIQSNMDTGVCNICKAIITLKDWMDPKYCVPICIFYLTQSTDKTIKTQVYVALNFLKDIINKKLVDDNSKGYNWAETASSITGRMFLDKSVSISPIKNDDTDIFKPILKMVVLYAIALFCWFNVNYKTESSYLLHTSHTNINACVSQTLEYLKKHYSNKNEYIAELDIQKDKLEIIKMTEEIFASDPDTYSEFVLRLMQPMTANNLMIKTDVKNNNIININPPTSHWASRITLKTTERMQSPILKYYDENKDKLMIARDGHAHRYYEYENKKISNCIICDLPMETTKKTDIPYDKYVEIKTLSCALTQVCLNNKQHNYSDNICTVCGYYDNYPFERVYDQYKGGLRVVEHVSPIKVISNNKRSIQSRSNVLLKKSPVVEEKQQKKGIYHSLSAYLRDNLTPEKSFSYLKNFEDRILKVSMFANSICKIFKKGALVPEMINCTERIRAHLEIAVLLNSQANTYEKIWKEMHSDFITLIGLIITKIPYNSPHIANIVALLSNKYNLMAKETIEEDDEINTNNTGDVDEMNDVVELEEEDETFIAQQEEEITIEDDIQDNVEIDDDDIEAKDI